jgi:hypothetical protein
MSKKFQDSRILRNTRRRTAYLNQRRLRVVKRDFFEDIEKQSVEQDDYNPIVFQACLRFLPEEETTELLLHEEKITDIPFLVDNTSSCHYAVSARVHGFDAGKEAKVLSKHIRQMSISGLSCHLMVQTKENKVCSSIVECRFRRWVAEKGIARCALH